MEFPRLVYRLGGPWALEAGNFSVLEVADEAAMDAATADGWHLDQYAAREAEAQAEAQANADFAARIASDDTPADEGAAPKLTREELEAKASELGVPFGPKVSDKKLAGLVAAAIDALNS